MTNQITIGTYVHASQMAVDSFFLEVKGFVREILKNGWVRIEADQVRPKFNGQTWRKHPSTCMTSARIENLQPGFSADDLAALKNRGYDELVAFCEKLNLADLRLVKAWWMNPETDLFSGYANVHNENSRFSRLLADQIKVLDLQRLMQKFQPK
jgi:hypothetical protein